MTTQPKKGWRNYWIFRPINDLYHSLFNNDNGFSFRKIGAAFSMYVGYNISLAIVDDKIKFYATLAWIIAALVFVGLVTIPQLIEAMKTAKDAPKPPDTPTETKPQDEEENE